MATLKVDRLKGGATTRLPSRLRSVGKGDFPVKLYDAIYRRTLMLHCIAVF